MTDNTVTYAQLNIGRNVGAEPMAQDRWEWFVSTAQSILMGAQALQGGSPMGDSHRKDVQVHYGTGVWGGVAEESAHVSLFWESGMRAGYIREQAAIIARMFDQDAVAVILGSELATP